MTDQSKTVVSLVVTKTQFEKGLHGRTLTAGEWSKIVTALQSRLDTYIEQGFLDTAIEDFLEGTLQ